MIPDSKRIECQCFSCNMPKLTKAEYEKKTGRKAIDFVLGGQKSQRKKREFSVCSSEVYRDILESNPPVRRRNKERRFRPVEDKESVSFTCEECNTEIKSTKKDETVEDLRREHLASLGHQVNVSLKKRKEKYEPVMVYPLQNTIGYDLLRKEGWEHGQGLGAEKQGRKVPLRVKEKRDNLGIGAVSTQSTTDETLASVKDEKLEFKEYLRKTKKDEEERLALLGLLKTGNDYSQLINESHH